MGECSLKELVKMYDVKSGDWFMAFSPSSVFEVASSDFSRAKVVLGQFGKEPFYREETVPNRLVTYEGLFIIGSHGVGKIGSTIVFSDIKPFWDRKEIPIWYDKNRPDSTRVYIGAPEIWVGLMKEGYAHLRGLAEQLMTKKQQDQVFRRLAENEARRRVHAGEKYPKGMSAGLGLIYTRAEAEHWLSQDRK